MKILFTYTRSTFWITGVVTILVALNFLAGAAREAGTKPALAAIRVFVALVAAGAGAVICLAARAPQGGSGLGHLALELRELVVSDQLSFGNQIHGANVE